MPLNWEAVEDLTEEGAKSAAEIEDAGRIPDRLLQRIDTSGIFRMLVPADLGGWGATPAECFRASVRIASGDGSLGWQVASAVYFNAILTAVTSPALQKEFFKDPHALLAGGVVGAGTATAVPDGFEVEGSWSFSTGCWHASWLGGLCVETVVDAPSNLRWVMVPADRAEVHANWDVAGLRGTGSDTVTVPRQIVPADWAFLYPVAVDQTLPSTDRAARYGRGLWPTATAAAATQLGIARRALDEIVTFAQAKRRPRTTQALISEQAFQRELFTAEAAWRAAYAGLGQALEALWEAEGATYMSVDTRVDVRLAATHAAQTGAQIVRTCFDLGGASVIERQHPLARCHRDGTILDKHSTVNTRTLEMLARATLRLDPDNPFL